VADIWWIVAALVIGILVGAAGFWLATRKGGAPGTSVRQLKQENEKFREEVNDHFVQTAELINRLTDSYKAVFDHLSDGAGRLVEDKVIRERMPQVSGQEVRLKPIGAPRPDTPAGAAKPKSPEKPTPASPTQPPGSSPRSPSKDPGKKT